MKEKSKTFKGAIHTNEKHIEIKSSGWSSKIKIIDPVTGLVTYKDNILEEPVIVSNTNAMPVAVEPIVVMPVVNKDKYDKKGLRIKVLDQNRELGTIEINEILTEFANGITEYGISKNLQISQERIRDIVSNNKDKIIELRGAIKDLSLRSLEERIKRMDKIEFMMFEAITPNKINDERASFLINSIKAIEQARAVANGNPQDNFEESIIPKTRDGMQKFILNINVTQDKNKVVIIDEVVKEAK